MAFTPSTDSTILYSAASTMQIRDRAVFSELFTREYEGGVQSARTFKIPNPDYNQSVATYTRGADFGTPNTASQAFIDLTIDQYEIIEGSLDFIDDIELELDYVERIRSEQTIKMTNAMDTNYLAYLNSLTIGAGQTIASSNTAANNAYDISAGSYGSAVGEVLYRQINDFADAMKGSGALDGLGDTDVGMWAVLPVKAWREVTDYLNSRRLSLDVLTEGILSRNAAFSQRSFEGHLSGVTIMTSNKMTAPTSAGDYKFWYGTNRAVAQGVRPVYVQTISPEENQTSPFFVMRQITQYGRVLVNPEVLFLGGIEAVA